MSDTLVDEIPVNNKKAVLITHHNNRGVSTKLKYNGESYTVDTYADKLDIEQAGRRHCFLLNEIITNLKEISNLRQAIALATI